MDESEGDDGAIFEVWVNLTPEQVDALHDLVAFLGDRWQERRDGIPGALPVALLAVFAIHLAHFGLGHLPVVAEVLDAAAAP